MAAKIDQNLCQRCGTCYDICPQDVFGFQEDEIPTVDYPDECWYCGACVIHCPVDAVSIIFPDEMLNCKTDVMSLMGMTLEEASKKKSLSGSLPEKA